MHIDVKAKEEDGSVIFEGALNKPEVNFLLSYAINDLMAAGVQFNLNLEDTGESRIVVPKDQVN